MMISVHVFGLVTSKDESKKSIKLKNILILILFAILHTIINLYLDSSIKTLAICLLYTMYFYIIFDKKVYKSIFSSVLYIILLIIPDLLTLTIITKILNILTIVMFVITVVLLGLFYFGGELPNSQYSNPVYTEQLIWWSYILFAVAIIAAVIFPIIRLFTRPKEAMKSFIALAGIVILVLIAYSMSDGTIMEIPGYSGSDNVPGTLKLTDTILITTYFLGIGAIGAIIVTEIIRRVR